MSISLTKSDKLKLKGVMFKQANGEYIYRLNAFKNDDYFPEYVEDNLIDLLNPKFTTKFYFIGKNDLAKQLALINYSISIQLAKDNFLNGEYVYKLIYNKTHLVEYKTDSLDELLEYIQTEYSNVTGLQDGCYLQH